jgi:hypothetical protein
MSIEGGSRRRVRARHTRGFWIRRSLVILSVVLTACNDPAPDFSGASAADHVPPSSTEGSPHPDLGGSPSTTILPTLRELAHARARLLTSPPTIHGVFEVENDADPALRWELWVQWPAFRMETTSAGGPVTIASEDGHRFMYRDGDEVGTSTGLGEEGAILLSPLLPFADYFGPSCDEQVLGIEERLGRQVLHVRCPEDRSESWIDIASGLPLASLTRDSGPGGDALAGYTSIEFDADIDPALFDASSP